MDAGFEVYNEQGYLQASHRVSNLSLIAKGSLLINGAGTGIDVSGRCPVLALQCSNPVVIRRVTVSGSTWGFGVYCPLGSLTATLNWWAFDFADLASASAGVGIEVFDVNGLRTFHTASKPFRVVGSLNETGSFNGQAGRQYATVQTGFGSTHIKEVDPENGTTETYEIAGASVTNGNQVSSATGTYTYNYDASKKGGESSEEHITDGSFLVVDVTNL